MFEEARNNIEKTTRRGMALYFGTINLAGETVTHPTKILRGIERRGERVLKQIENNNKQIRRNVTLLQKRTDETASSVRGTAKATVGLANDAKAPSRSARRRSTGRRRTTARSRVAAAGRALTGSTSASRGTLTRGSSTTRSGSRSKAAVATQRSQAAQKAARTRALNGRKAEAKKAVAVARARTTRATNESKGTLEKAQARVQQGFQQVGQQVDHVGERIERTIDRVAS
jgi:hypothetical protein